MTRHGIPELAASFLAVVALPLLAAEPAAEEKGTYLGALFSPVSDAAHARMPQLPHASGVLITHVLPDSPAALAGLRRRDILLRYDNEKVRDCEHFARLIQADKPRHKVRLELLRAGKTLNVEATLSLGPALRIAPAARERSAEVVRAIAKPPAPPTVSVAATPLEPGKMQVTIEYYQEGTGRMRSLTYRGRPTEIDRQVENLPDRQKALVRVALQRIRDLNSRKTSQAHPIR